LGLQRSNTNNIRFVVSNLFFYLFYSLGLGIEPYVLLNQLYLPNKDIVAGFNNLEGLIRKRSPIQDQRSLENVSNSAGFLIAVIGEDNRLGQRFDLGFQFFHSLGGSPRTDQQSVIGSCVTKGLDRYVLIT
jgi:hypothetical protein